MFSYILTSLTNCFVECEQRTLYGALAVTLAILLCLINSRFIVIIICAADVLQPAADKWWHGAENLRLWHRVRCAHAYDQQQGQCCLDGTGSF